MHVLLVLSSVALVVLAGALGLRFLRRVCGWPRRRDAQMLVLAAPLVSLGVGIGAHVHFAGQVCWLGAPPWDETTAVAVPLVMGAVAAGALLLGVVRLGLLARVVHRASLPADAELQGQADRLAARAGAPLVRVRVCLQDQPLALTHGLWRPTLLLSTWMLEHLDQQELESVLSHELAHAARRDYLVTWLATVLRDAFWYLPTSRTAFALLRREKELACDDAAVAATRRPLALASALAKVWQQALTAAPLTGGLGAVPALVDDAGAAAGAPIEQRIERLLDARPWAAGSTGGPLRSRALAFGMGSSALGGLLALEAANAAVLLAPMGCGPHGSVVSLLAHLL